jgi:hypothetical protein
MCAPPFSNALKSLLLQAAISLENFSAFFSGFSGLVGSR